MGNCTDPEKQIETKVIKPRPDPKPRLEQDILRVSNEYSNQGANGESNSSRPPPPPGPPPAAVQQAPQAATPWDQIGMTECDYNVMMSEQAAENDAMYQARQSAETAVELCPDSGIPVDDLSFTSKVGGTRKIGGLSRSSGRAQMRTVLLYTKQTRASASLSDFSAALSAYLFPCGFLRVSASTGEKEIALEKPRRAGDMTIEPVEPIMHRCVF